MSNHACGTALACRPLFTLSMLAVTTVLDGTSLKPMESVSQARQPAECAR